MDENAVAPSDDWLALGWDMYDLDYLGEVLGNFIDHMDEHGYF